MQKYEKLLQRLNANDPRLTELNFGCTVTLYGGLYYDRLHDKIAEPDILEILLAIRSNTYIKKLILPLHRSTSNEIAYALAKVSVPILSLSCNKLTDEGAIAIASSPYLRELIISSSGIGDKSAIAFAENTSLLSLEISCNHITDIGAKALASNPTLKTLNLEYNHGITAEGAISFASNTSLTSLNMSGRNIGDEGAEALAKNTCLQKLYLHNNQISDTGAKKLANNTSLVELDLSSNKIEMAGAKALAANTILLKLNLANNKITTDGALAFANNTSLTSLYVADKAINGRKTTRKINTMLSNNQLKTAQRSNLFIMSLLKWAKQPEGLLDASVNNIDFKILPVELKTCILLYLDTATFLSLVGLKHFAHIGKTEQQAYACMNFILNNANGIKARLTDNDSPAPIIKEKMPALGEYSNYSKHFSFYKPAPIRAVKENDEPKLKRKRLA